MLTNLSALLVAVAFQQPLTVLAPVKPAVDSVQASYVPHRVYDTRNKRFTDFESMVADLMYADVVFLG